MFFFSSVSVFASGLSENVVYQFQKLSKDWKRSQARIKHKNCIWNWKRYADVFPNLYYIQCFRKVPNQKSWYCGRHECGRLSEKVCRVFLFGFCVSNLLEMVRQIQTEIAVHEDEKMNKTVIEKQRTRLISSKRYTDVLFLFAFRLSVVRFEIDLVQRLKPVTPTCSRDTVDRYNSKVRQIFSRSSVFAFQIFLGQKLEAVSK